MNVEALLQDAVDEPTPRAIAAAISQLAGDGILPAGTRLPTVRTMARTFHVSASTIGDAWHLLLRNGIIRTEGRRGTFVSQLSPVSMSVRARHASGDDRYALDLTTGTPDTRLLPELHADLGVLSKTAAVTTYREPLVVPRLEQLLRDRWAPVVVPERVLIVDGALDAIDRIFREHLVVGDRILVEEVSLPAFFDLIDAVGAVPIGVPIDEHGMVPEAVAERLAERPTALLLQNRAHNPTGISMSMPRARELAEVLDGTGTLVIEDDASGDIASAPLASLSRWHPATVHVKSFSKSHGPDLRLAALAGPRELLDAIEVRRRLGPGWSSRLLQHLLTELLLDESVEQQIARAREVYAARRGRLRAALEARGLRTHGNDGVNLWVDVADERVAVRLLRDRGIGVTPGQPFRVTPSAAANIRVTCAAIDDDVESLAEHIAWAGRQTRPGLRANAS